MNIQIDTREKDKAIQGIIKALDRAGVKHYRSKLYVGDYMSLDNPRLVIDRKQNLNELCNNVCQQHERFVSELKRAQDSGIKVIILCEHGGNVKTFEDVKKWWNPRLRVSPKAVSGLQLYKILYTMRKKYNVEFVFCDKNHTGEEIIKLLGGNRNE